VPGDVELVRDAHALVRQLAAAGQLLVDDLLDDLGFRLCLNLDSGS
jgi:hypothetical protein